MRSIAEDTLFAKAVLERKDDMKKCLDHYFVRIMGIFPEDYSYRVYTTSYIRAAEEIFEDCSMAMYLLEDLSFAGREYVCIVKKGDRLADAVNTQLIRITLKLKKVPALVAKGDML